MRRGRLLRRVAELAAGKNRLAGVASGDNWGSFCASLAGVAVWLGEARRSVSAPALCSSRSRLQWSSAQRARACLSTAGSASRASTSPRWRAGREGAPCRGMRPSRGTPLFLLTGASDCRSRSAWRSLPTWVQTMPKKCRGRVSAQTGRWRRKPSASAATDCPMPPALSTSSRGSPSRAARWAVLPAPLWPPSNRPMAPSTTKMSGKMFGTIWGRMSGVAAVVPFASGGLQGADMRTKTRFSPAGSPLIGLFDGAQPPRKGRSAEEGAASRHIQVSRLAAGCPVRAAWKAASI